MRPSNVSSLRVHPTIPPDPSYHMVPFDIQNVKDNLPVQFHRENFLSGLREESQTLLILGETGSGKSTQVREFLLVAYLDPSKPKGFRGFQLGLQLGIFVFNKTG